MSTEEFILDTQRVMREINQRQEIYDIVFYSVMSIVMVGCLVVLIGWFIANLKAKKAAKRTACEKVVGGYAFRPVVTEEIQVIDGIEWHRMGVAGRVPE